MSSRKQRLGKSGSKRKAPSDVSPSTSLPPLVEGQLRCFLRVTVNRLLWTIHKPPSATFVRLRWWGETSTGTHFYPRDGSQTTQKSVKTTARFPIRCGPKQFTSYLTDMGYIVFEVLTKPDHLPIARAQVAGIPRLSLSNSIGGFYTLVSPTSEKMGELQVSLCLEPLTEAYDSSSSCPATDISLDKAPQEIMLKAVSSDDGKGLSGNTGGNTPRGKDHLYFQSKNQDKILNEIKVHGNTQINQPSTNCSDPTSNLLSVVLERGNKLRNAMVGSAVKTDINSASTLRDAPLPLSRDNILLNTNPSPTSGALLQNILEANTSFDPSSAVTAISDQGLDTSAHIEQKAIDLLLGSMSPPLWDELSALSHPSSLCGDSELNDPQYDQSLLENLFYKTPVIDEQLANSEVCSHEQQQKPALSNSNKPPLSEDQLNLLSSIQLLRVCVDSLALPCENWQTKNVRKGKPPRPSPTKKCTYSLEYVIPQTTASQKKAEEINRVISSKTVGDVVKFGQRSSFPVHFNTAAVKQWWESNLIFCIYMRRSDQTKPVFVGKAVHQLRSLLQSRSLSQSLLLPVDVEKEAVDIGPLKVSLELVTGKNDSEKPEKTLPQRDTNPWDTSPNPIKTQPVNKKKSAGVSFGPLDVSRSPPQRLTGESRSQNKFPTSPLHQVQEDETDVLLHTLLMVPDGRDFQCSLLQSPNVYLNCKLFWCDETARSQVAWGQSNPKFNFMQVTPVALTSKLLERMKNNVMVIEVWQKMGNPKQDHLLGLVKLPLHQFYMSFRDMKIAHLLLQAQYPVLGVDCYMPVIDVFSGNCKGNLRVILAMGRSEQIAALQSARGEEYPSHDLLVRPVHLLDHKPHSKLHEVTKTVNEVLQEHLFVIKVEKVVGLTPLQSTVWGEADCYIQYSFPCQDGDLTATADLIESTINIKPFRSTTTLCIPDPVFGHTERHVLLTPEDVPIQKILLTALTSQGLGGGGGVQFEVWCRYYYPNVRDQLVAKAMLPLSKLCALITMQRLHNEAQLFSLPLIPWSDGNYEPQPSGLLEVGVQYKHRPVRPEGQMGRGAASRVVTLVIQIHRASGLKAAARAVAETNERFSYYTSVGVNCYITAQLSFLSEREKRCTRIVARSFSPEFNHHMEMCCDLLLQRSKGESFSLAEQLEQASAIFSVWNRESRKGVESSHSKDVLLGTVKVPLAELIYKRTGISGWFGLYASKQTSPQDQQILVGGVEISVSFSHHSDRERVIKAAQGLGWEMAFTVCDREMDDDSWHESLSKISLTIAVPRAWIPLHCLLLPGLKEMQRSTYCYFRYKFYDQEAFCSHMKHPVVESSHDESVATVSFEGSTCVELKRTHPLIWYLREEKLEIQTWVSFTKVKTQRPCDSDRLVGSVFLDLSSLTKFSKQKLTLSGVYPMFRRSAADLQGAAARVHITLVQDPGPRMILHRDSSIQEDELFSDEPEDRAAVSNEGKTIEKSHQQTKSAVQQTEVDDADSFPVNITVDKAMNLNLKGCPLADRSEGTPCCCVSYITSDSEEPVFTAVVLNSDSPEWDHQNECRLSKELLLDPQQSLVFKVWHKGEMDRAIGFASVDLTPLLCGLPSVCGWYNVTDFSGQCHGQLKVSITPLKGIQNLKVHRKSEETPTNSGLFRGLPISYHTTATYSSFPSHILRHPEQKISSPDHTEIFSDRSSESDRHFEHMNKVRLYHQTLQEQTTAPSVIDSGDLNPSSSILFSTLRRNLGELDNIQKYFSCKFSTPTFPPASGLDANHKQEDSHQLLLRSNMLVGQVNNIISGLQAQPLETTPPGPQNTQSQPPDDPTLQTERAQTPPTTSDSFHSAPSITLTSEKPPLTDDNDLQSVEEAELENVETAAPEEEKIQESDTEEQAGSNKDQDSADDGDNGDEDKDYEETVVEPRHLNELTSLTDKTSPWTSVLSDPDLVSLESIDTESPRENELHKEGSRARPHSDCEDDISHKAEQSSDTEESDVKSLKTCESLHLDARDKKQEVHSDSEEEPNVATSSEVHQSLSPVQDLTLPKPPDIPEVPNFFMTPLQLEASMKAIRLAPTFSRSPVDSEPSTAPARGPRQRPNMSPSTLKKETDRIARIFAARFDEGHRD